jgi:septal ring factor EnvC (AmiA/AmiB activator)
VKKSYVVAFLGLAAMLPLCRAATPTNLQLETVQIRIEELEQRLARLAVESAGVAAERERLNAEYELARARVEENELTLQQTQVELGEIRGEVSRLAADLVSRQDVLRLHLEMAALLGRPGPLQLMFDAAQNGQFEEAVSTIAVLTTGQVRLLEEYNDLRARHAARLAALSQIMQQSRQEARDLSSRRRELEQTQKRVEARLSQLTRSKADTGMQLADLREREQALQRLIGVLASRERLTGKEDIRRYRGALPWPADGEVVLSFGRHYLPKYSTYTVCNGIRFDVSSGAPVRAVFPGMVAFARHFKGYGNMVVVDHGRGVYSLVAGLATIHVRLNQRVTMGLRLGLASPPKEDGNVYFEIRVGEDPQDPRRWIQLEEDR